jgi:NADH dehydrogenase
METSNAPIRVVIVGGGFGGLRAAKTLACKSEVCVTLIDRHNYHLFQPLLYQVATAGLSPADIAVPIRSVIGSARNIEIVLGTVTSIDTSLKKLIYDSTEMHYDFLIVASGAMHSYFSHPEWEPLAPGLKTLEQATEIRRRVLLAYERAEIESDPIHRKALLTFVIVGGGPTGVELAGAIAEISRQTLAKDFKKIDPSQARVILIEANQRILSAFAEDLSKIATRDLEQMGVQIWTNSRVSGLTPNSVLLGNESIASETVIWAAGVKPSELGRFLGCDFDSLGRVKVNETLSLNNHPEVFVIGDLAHFVLPNQQSLPGLAPVALQQGEWAALNILESVHGKPYRSFKYVDKGMMATIGRKKAIMQFRGLRVSGFVAWLAWLLIHIFYLIDFKNKIFVFLNWCWSYFTFRKGARLIVDKLEPGTDKSIPR